MFSWIILAASFLLGSVYFAAQPVATYQGGVFLDSAQYARMATQADPPGALKPFAYRVALPWIVGHLFPDDVLLGFRVANLLFGWLTLCVFVVLIDRVLGNPWITALLSLVFITSLHGVFRFHAFYPITTDPPAYFFTALFLLVAVERESSSWGRAALLAVIAIIGAVFRETTVLAPAAAFVGAAISLRNHPDGKSSLLRSTVPLVAGMATVELTHRLVITNDGYTFHGQALQMLQVHWNEPLPFLLAPFAAYGPVALLPIVFFGAAIGDFCRRFPIIPIYLVTVLGSVLIGGYHEVRLAYPGILAILPLAGVVIASLVSRGPLWFRLCVFLVIGIAQLLASNPFGTMPDLDSLSEPSPPELYAFLPYGRHARYQHVSPHSMGVDLQHQMLLQYREFGSGSLRLACLRHPARLVRSAGRVWHRMTNQWRHGRVISLPRPGSPFCRRIVPSAPA